MAKSTFSLPQLDIHAIPGPDTIHRTMLDNGITVLVRENFVSPSVVINGLLPIGSLIETRENAGRAYLTSLALMRGTDQRSFQEIFDALESVGAALSISAATHSTVFRGKSLAEDLDLLLATLSDVLQNPSFPQAEVERLRAQMLTSFAIREQDTGARAEMAFDGLVYPGHPYSLQNDGYPESVSALTIAEMKKYHRNWYAPLGMTVVIVGGVKANKSEMPALPELKPVKSTTRSFVPLEGKSQCDIVLGTAGPSRWEADFLPAALGNNILGRFGQYGRIGDSVRERSGLAYYSYSTISGGPGPGPWQVIAGVNPINLEYAIQLITEEIRRFTSTKVKRQELLENKANLIGRLPLQLESNEGVAGALLNMERYDLGLDYYQRYPDLIAGITADEILATAQRYLDPDRLAIGIAGPPEDGQ